MAISVRLVSIDPFLPALSLEFHRFPVLVGSSEGADMVLEGRWVSAKHCELELRDEELFLRHLDKQRETFVNGKPVRSAALASGDELVIGIRAFSLEVVNQPDPKQEANPPVESSIEFAG